GAGAGWAGGGPGAHRAALPAAQGGRGPVGAPETGRNRERMGGHAAMLAAAAQSLPGGAGLAAVRQLMRAVRAGLEPCNLVAVTTALATWTHRPLSFRRGCAPRAMTLPPSGGLMGDAVASEDPARWPGRRAW